MILNVSGRTDIVAFYSDWFINRYREGYVDVRNPFNKKLVSRIYFEDVDLILFCTKNPKPILKYLNEITCPIIFHITITPYKKDIEPGVPDKKDVIESVKKISEMIGIDNVYVRYDPIFLSEKYNISYHLMMFERLCNLLDGYVNNIIASFIDDYKNVLNNQSILKKRAFTLTDYKSIGIGFSEIATKHNMTVQTCFEDNDLVQYGFIKRDCLSHTLAFKLTGNTYKGWKARKENKCNCVQMVDIGEYNTCKHFCKYCYANYDEKKVIQNNLRHYDDSSLLVGRLETDDIIKRRGK